MTSKVVSLVVVVVIFAMVLVPILNTIVENGNGGNDDGEDSIEIINDIQRKWADDGVELTFNSYEYYFRDSTPTLPHEFSFDKQDLMSAVSSYPEGEYSCEIPLFVYFTDVTMNWYQEMYLDYDNYGDEPSINVVLDDNGTSLNDYYDRIWTIHTDYTMTDQVKYSENDEWSTYTTDAPLDGFIIMSDSDEGGYCLYQYGIIDPVFGVGSTIYVSFSGIGVGYVNTVLTEDMFVDGVLRIPYTFEVTHDGSDSTDIYDIVIEWDITEVEPGRWVMSASGDYWTESGTLYMPYSGTLNGSATSGTSFASFAGVSMGVPSNEPSGSGSGGDSNGNGVVGTLISIIPVFVGLAILIYVVTRFMPERQNY